MDTARLAPKLKFRLGYGLLSFQNHLQKSLVASTICMNNGARLRRDSSVAIWDVNIAPVMLRRASRCKLLKLFIVFFRLVAFHHEHAP